MAYSNKVARSRGTTINQNQGGGSKKAGFPISLVALNGLTFISALPHYKAVVVKCLDIV